MLNAHCVVRFVSFDRGTIAPLASSLPQRRLSTRG